MATFSVPPVLMAGVVGAVVVGLGAVVVVVVVDVVNGAVDDVVVDELHPTNRTEASINRKVHTHKMFTGVNLFFNLITPYKIPNMRDKQVSIS